MPRNVVVLLDNQAGRNLVKEVCTNNGFDFGAFENLLQVEVEQTGKQRRAGLWGSFDEILDRIEIGE